MNEPETIVPKNAQQILEIPTQEEVNQALETEQNPEPEATQEPEPIKQFTEEEGYQKRQFANLREKAERAERERDDALRILREVEYSRRNQQAPLIAEEDDSFTIGPDDLAEGKHLSKVQKKIQKLEQQLKNYEQKATESMLETQLRVNYPDFNTVVSKENIDTLREEYPEIAATINSSQDHYSRAAAAYKLIKKLGINQQTPSYDADKAKVQQNAQKPRPLASVSPQRGDSALSRANAFADGKLSKDLAEQLLKEMTEARKAY